jgi:hypothetical protein
MSLGSADTKSLPIATKLIKFKSNFKLGEELKKAAKKRW